MSASVEDAGNDGDLDLVVRVGGVVVYAIETGALVHNVSAEWERFKRKRLKKSKAKRAK